MTFHAGAIRGFDTARSGSVDYRLARQHLVNEYKRGRLAQNEVCDAHPELVRNAEHCGDATSVVCPICEETTLTLVSYVFGPRLPSHGRCLSRKGELRQLARTGGEFTCYVVEVCRQCRWNHLARVFPVTRETTRAAR